ncbi:GntR family transcriptional regulator [Streptomonospora nanhaiensis]|uniref:GntR family transcriptional regulator n=1 Tax=Streptomonospora nanhaiensis TaxID=1323731 RepID=UPI001C383A85|nr:GntR family transcriptional regulator [Streptomonospora nanhaiensis]MBV2367128.1 GntR family transcriptional regulator [Streptomonospora nanhaiensis]
MASDQPLWESVYRDLRRQIDSGELPPGAPVPTELDLSKQHQVSRPVVRQALGQLQQDGLISRGQGRRGRQVRDPRPIEWRLHQFERGARRDGAGHDDWAAAIAEQGRTPRQDVRVSVEAADSDVASALELEPGTMVVRRSRVRYVDGVPYQLSTSFFPEDLARDTLLMEPNDVAVPGGILRHIGSPQVSVRDTITIRMPSPDEAARLDIASGTPVGQHSRTGYGEDGTPVRHMITVFPGDRHYLVYELDLT